MSEADRIAQAYRGRDLRDANRWDLNNPGNQRILAERRGMARRLLQARGWLPLARKTVLDVGCGGGAELAWFRELGASPAALTGVDLLPERIEVARRSFPELNFQQGNAERLPFAAESFDLLVAYTLFSSILDQTMAGNVAAEIVRVM
ncbi:MAG TPA: class I SAM-dependent methyltransferase, partial [Candidatus Dormibacteraeota bacterium]|nr:class I SAM-dependent methyltransferase [Candidatus Dormibacteraeota bacterium]